MFELISRGGWAMIPLLGCSFVAVAVVVERLLFWRRFKRQRDRKIVERILSFVSVDQDDEAGRIARESNDPIAKVLEAGLLHRVDTLSQSMEIRARETLRGMRRYSTVLDTIITLAPLLGILGTVTGIIQSFDLLGEMGVQDPRSVVGGIAEALITTAAGLVIAMGSLIPYNYFQHRVDDVTHDLETYATELEVLIKKKGADDEISVR